MRRELKKQLTELRRIQDAVFAKGTLSQSMYIAASPIGDGQAAFVVDCFDGRGIDAPHIEFMLWLKPHSDEPDYGQMLVDINNFFGFTSKITKS